MKADESLLALGRSADNEHAFSRRLHARLAVVPCGAPTVLDMRMKGNKVVSAGENGYAINQMALTASRYGWRTLDGHMELQR